jgi:2-methylcitrate dehydratase PrpD
VAWSLRHGGFGLEATEPAALAEPACAALRERVTLVCGPIQDRAYPQSFGARLQLQMANGSQHSSEVVNVLGDPENPLSPEQVRAKANQLLQASGWGMAQAEQLIGLVGALPQAHTLEPLWDSLQAELQPQKVSSAQASESKRSS